MPPPSLLVVLLLIIIATVSAQPPATTNHGGHHNVQQRENARKHFGWLFNNMDFNNHTIVAQEFIHAHNWVRKQYNIPPLAWDEKLASFARGYLMEHYEDCKLLHSKSNFGENVFWGKKINWTPSDAVYHWYMEKQWYDFNTLKCMPPPKACGHFTQIVWRDSARVGCALQHCHVPGMGMLIACEYDPPGNFVNEHPLQTHVGA